MNLRKQVEPLLKAALQASSLQRHAHHAASRLTWVIRWLKRACRHHAQSRELKRSKDLSVSLAAFARICRPRAVRREAIGAPAAGARRASEASAAAPASGGGAPRAVKSTGIARPTGIVIRGRLLRRAKTSDPITSVANGSFHEGTRRVRPSARDRAGARARRPVRPARRRARG